MVFFILDMPKQSTSTSAMQRFLILGYVIILLLCDDDNVGLSLQFIYYSNFAYSWLLASKPQYATICSLFGISSQARGKGGALLDSP